MFGGNDPLDISILFRYSKNGNIYNKIMGNIMTVYQKIHSFLIALLLLSFVIPFLSLVGVVDAQEYEIGESVDVGAPIDLGAIGVIIRTDSRPQISSTNGSLSLDTVQGASLSVVNQLNANYGVEDIDTVGTMGALKDMVSIELPVSVDIEEAVAQYEADPNVLYAVPNYLEYGFSVPNDPYYNGDDPLNYFQWNLARIKMQEAWAYMEEKGLDQGGSADIKVAVIDGGVAFEDYGEYKKAPELAGVRFSNPKSFRSIEFPTGLCSGGVMLTAMEVTSHPNDDGGHGTHVAGTIAQMTGNASHAAGIAGNVTVIPIKVLHACKDSGGNHSAVGSMVDILAGMEHAMASGANVINMSLGKAFVSTDYPGGITDYLADNQAYIDMLDLCTSKGISVIVATGNEADGAISEGVGRPSALPGAFAVGSTKWDNAKSSFSNFGAPYSSNGLHGVDLVAPGGELVADGMVNDQNSDLLPDAILQQTILSGDPSSFTDPANYPPSFEGPPYCLTVDPTDGSVDGVHFGECGVYQGTSMAAPHVSAVAALIYSLKPDSTTEQVYSLLKDTANNVDIPGYASNSEWYGAGLLDAEAAVKAVGGGGSDDLEGDLTGDGRVDIEDLEAIVDLLGADSIVADFVEDGVINIFDLEYVVDRLGTEL